MRFLQRIFAVLAGIVLFLLLPAIEKDNRMQKQSIEWKKIVLQRLCEEICASGECTENEYLRCQEVLQNGTKQYELHITEYQRKEDKYAMIHWYPITWQDIKILKK